MSLLEDLKDALEPIEFPEFDEILMDSEADAIDEKLTLKAALFDVYQQNGYYL